MKKREKKRNDREENTEISNKKAKKVIALDTEFSRQSPCKMSN